jgi:transcriptional regulator with XRE-family HTH domain
MLGMKLAEYLKATGVSMYRVAKDSGLSQAHIANVARGAPAGRTAALAIEKATGGRVCAIESLGLTCPRCGYTGANSDEAAVADAGDAHGLVHLAPAPEGAGHRSPPPGVA